MFGGDFWHGQLWYGDQFQIPAHTSFANGSTEGEGDSGLVLTATVYIDGVFAATYPEYTDVSAPDSEVHIPVWGTDCNSVTNLDDNTDGSPDPDSFPAPGDCGMAIWQVSEPYISLWLHDEPLGYQPARGKRLSFDLGFKQRENLIGFDTNVFGVGKKWNCSWLSFIDADSNGSNIVHFPGGGQRTFYGTNDYLTDAVLTGGPASAFILTYPDGEQDVFGLVVTNSVGQFQKAFLTERWNPQQQKTLFDYAAYDTSFPVIRLSSVIDGDGRTNVVHYDTGNPYSTNLISSVDDPFGRSCHLSYDSLGRLTNILDPAGIFSRFTYDESDCVTNLATPYGTTSFTYSETTGTDIIPNGRSVLVTEADGAKQLFLYKDSAPGVASAYGTNEAPSTAPFSNSFETNNFNFRNTFHWGPRQFASLSTTNIQNLTSNDFRKASSLLK